MSILVGREVEASPLPTVDDFFAFEMERLELFRAHWKAENEKNSAAYPERMNPGDWDDQFQSFDPWSKETV